MLALFIIFTQDYREEIPISYKPSVLFKKYDKNYSQFCKKISNNKCKKFSSNQIIKLAFSIGRIGQSTDKQVALIANCENYLIILPRLMGCTVCQYWHEFSQGEKYEHYKKRKKQLEHMVEHLRTEELIAENFLALLDEMTPFDGKYGKLFDQKCRLILAGDEN